MIIRREKEYTQNDYCSLYRPCLVDEIVGQKISKKLIKNGLNDNTLPHSLLFSGPAGCGKTTAARIVALGLNCEEVEDSTANPCLECPSCLRILSNNSTDAVEINVGKEGGKADVEAVINKLDYSPLQLRYKVLIFDEAHKLTDAAKDLLLKPIEDGLDYVYFIFCTNQPEKLKKATKKEETPFIDRCTQMFFNTIGYEDINDLLKNICGFEGIKYEQSILDFIINESTGVPRKAIKWLEQVVLEKSWTPEAVNSIVGSSDEDNEDVKALCQSLNRGNFKIALKEYDKLKKTMTPESIRIIVALYFTACLRNANISGDSAKFNKILDVLLVPIYQDGKVGHMNLTHYFYKITNIINSAKGAYIR